MTNSFRRLFFIGKTRFPKISWGHRLEGIEYKTENNSLYIVSTFIGNRKIYTDSIKMWNDNQLIDKYEKAKIFENVLEFANKKSKEKPSIVINIDCDKAFWETLCQENINLIKEILYDSDKQKEDFQFNSLVEHIRKNETLIIGNKTFKSEAEFLEYWNNREK